MSRDVWPGRPFPLGPTWDGQGTNFSLFSEHATRVELCLFDGDDREERSVPASSVSDLKLATHDGVRVTGDAVTLPPLSGALLR